MPRDLPDLGLFDCETDAKLRLEVEYEKCGCRSIPGADPQVLMVLDISPGQKVKITQNHKHPLGEEEEQETQPVVQSKTKGTVRLCQTVNEKRALKGPRRLCDPRPDVVMASKLVVRELIFINTGFSQQQQALIIKVEK